MPRYENEHYLSPEVKKQPHLSRQYQSFEVLSTSKTPAPVQTTSPRTTTTQQTNPVLPVQHQQESYTHLTEWQSRRRANSNTSQQPQRTGDAEYSRPGPHNNYKNPLLKSSLSAENVNNETQEADELEQIAQNMQIDGTTPSLKRFYLKKDAPDDALSLLGLGNRHQPRQNLSQNDLNVIEKQQKK